MLSIHESGLIVLDSGWIPASAEMIASEDAVLVRAILSPIFQRIPDTSFLLFLGQLPGGGAKAGSWTPDGSAESLEICKMTPASVGKGESM